MCGPTAGRAPRYGRRHGEGAGFWWTEPAMLPRFPHPGAFLSTTSLRKHNKRNPHGQHTPAA